MIKKGFSYWSILIYTFKDISIVFRFILLCFYFGKAKFLGEFSSERFGGELPGIRINALATPIILFKKNEPFVFLCVIFPCKKSKHLKCIIYKWFTCPPSSRLSSISPSLSAHLAVVFHPARWKDQGVKGGRGVGGFPSSPLGTGTGTWNSWCAPKTNYRGPCPPFLPNATTTRLAEREGGGSGIVSIHRWALTRWRRWVGQMAGTAGAGYGFVLPRPGCMASRLVFYMTRSALSFKGFQPQDEFVKMLKEIAWDLDFTVNTWLGAALLTLQHTCLSPRGVMLLDGAPWGVRFSLVFTEKS